MVTARITTIKSGMARVERIKLRLATRSRYSCRAIRKVLCIGDLGTQTPFLNDGDEDVVQRGLCQLEAFHLEAVQASHLAQDFLRVAVLVQRELPGAVLVAHVEHAR